MALVHASTLVPTKIEIIRRWLPEQPWSPRIDDPESDIRALASYRFDDPAGEVGLETHLVHAGGTLVQIPLTYRGAPQDSGVLVSTMEHSVLGGRWVYHGMSDPAYVSMLAAATLTGAGHAVHIGEFDGRISVAPSTIRLTGGGWTSDGRLPVDGFGPASDRGAWISVTSDVLELTLAQLPAVATADGPALYGALGSDGEHLLLATARLR